MMVFIKSLETKVLVLCVLPSIVFAKSSDDFWKEEYTIEYLKDFLISVCASANDSYLPFRYGLLGSWRQHTNIRSTDTNLGKTLEISHSGYWNEDIGYVSEVVVDQRHEE